MGAAGGFAAGLGAAGAGDVSATGAGAGRDRRRLTVRQPDVIDRVLDPVQARARREHPAGEDALDLALQRHLVDLDEGVGVGCLGRRAGVAGAWCHLQRAELHGLADRHVEIDDAAGDLVEPGEQRALVDDLLRRRLDDDLVAGLQCAVGGRRRCPAWRKLAGRQSGLRRLSARRARIDRGGAGGRRQRLRLDAAAWRRRGRDVGLRRIRLLLFLLILLLRRIALLLLILPPVRIAIILIRIVLRLRGGAAARHPCGRARRCAEQRLERVELRLRGQRAESGTERGQRSDQKGRVK